MQTRVADEYLARSFKPGVALTVAVLTKVTDEAAPIQAKSIRHPTGKSRELLIVINII